MQCVVSSIGVSTSSVISSFQDRLAAGGCCLLCKDGKPTHWCSPCCGHSLERICASRKPFCGRPFVHARAFDASCVLFVDQHVGNSMQLYAEYHPHMCTVYHLVATIRRCSDPLYTFTMQSGAWPIQSQKPTVRMQYCNTCVQALPMHSGSQTYILRKAP